MSKIILTCILALSINLGTMQKSEAAVAAVVAIAGGGAAGAFAYTGLGIAATTLVIDVITESEGWFFLIGAMIGVVLLDENGNAELQLNDLSEHTLLTKGLTIPEVIAVLDNQEELESIFNTSNAKDQSAEESAVRWETAKQIYGEDAVSGFYKTLS